MAVAYLNVGTLSSFSGNTSVTPALPGLRANGNILIAEVMTKNGATHSLSGSGWTAIHAQQSNGSSMTVSRWWRWVDGTEAAPTISWSGSAAGYARIAQISRPNFDQGSAPFGAMSHNAGTGTTHTSTGVTTTRDNSRVFYFDSGNANTAIATPSGWTEHFDAGSTFIGASRNACGSKAVDTSGTGSGNISVVGAAGVYIQSQIEVLDAALPGDQYAVATGDDDGCQADVVDTTIRPNGQAADGANTYGNRLGSIFHGAIRFPGVNVANGDTVASAWLLIETTVPTGSDGWGSNFGTVYGYDVDDAPAWLPGTVYLSGVARTTASTPALASTSGNVVLAHDVTAIVQEIADRAGRVDGQAISFVIIGTGADGFGRFKDYNTYPSNAPKLVVELDASGGPASVTPANAAHPHTASSPTLSAKSSVTPNSAAHSQTATSPSLAAQATISPDGASHGHSATSPTLATQSSVAPDDAAHATTSTSPTVGVPVAISPDSAVSAHTASSPTIAANSSIAPDDSAHAHTASSPTVTTANSVAPDNAAHAQTASEPTIAAASSVSVDDAAHGHSVSSPSLTAQSSVQPDDSAHGHTASEPNLSAASTVAPDDAYHGSSATSPTVSTGGSVAVDSTAHDQTATSPTIAAQSSVSVDSAAHALTSTSPTVSAASSVQPNDADHAQAATSPSIAAKASVSIDSADHGQEASSPTLSGSLTITPASAVHAHIAGQPTIAWHGMIAANDAAHETTSSSPSLAAKASIAPASAVHSHIATSPALSAFASVSVDSAYHDHGASSPSIRITMPPSTARTIIDAHGSRIIIGGPSERIIGAGASDRTILTAAGSRTIKSVVSGR